MRRPLAFCLCLTAGCFGPVTNLAPDADPFEDRPSVEDQGVDDDLPPAEDRGLPAEDTGPDDVPVSPADLGPPADVPLPRDAGPDVPTAADVPGPRDTGTDTGTVRDTGIDTGTVRDTGIDTGTVRDTGIDTGPPRDTGVDVPVVRDGGVVTRPNCQGVQGARPGVPTPTLQRALTGAGDEGWLGSPAVVDLDRDGSLEIVAARGARLLVWSATTGARRFAFAPGAGRIWAGAVVTDLVGNANPEVAVAAGNRVFAVDGSGTALSGFPATFVSELRALAAGDLDGDGRDELVAATTSPRSSPSGRDLIAVVRGNGSPVPAWPAFAAMTTGCDDRCYISGAYDQNLAVGRIDGDNRADIFAPMDNAYAGWFRASGEAFPLVPGMFSGAARSPGLRFFLNEADARRGYATNESTALQAHFTNSPPVLADLDDDGTTDLLVLSSVQNASQSNRLQGVALWALHPDGTRLTGWSTPYHAPMYRAGLLDLGNNIVAETQQPAVADLDARRPGLDVVFAGFDGVVRAVDASRTLRWSYAFTNTNDVLTAGVALADLDGDARPEVIFATYTPRVNAGALYILSPDGEFLQRLPLPGRGSMAVPTVADVDGNGDIEIVVSLKDRGSAGEEVMIYTLAGSRSACLPWPTGRGSYTRAGVGRL